MKLLSKIANLLSMGLTGLACLLLLVVTVLPGVASYKTYVVLSGSMEPAIPTGAVVMALPVAPSSLKVGDVIVYNRSDVSESVTHRIVEVDDGPVFRTKGDANGAPDEWTVQYTNGTAGKIVLSLPYAGYLYHAVATPQGRLLFLVGPIIVLSVMWLAQIWRPNLNPRRVDREIPRAIAPDYSVVVTPPAAATVPQLFSAKADPPPLPLRR